ncbi:MAG: T9SS type A sorting domain-containing protein [Cytophagaceae bacterium]
MNTALQNINCPAGLTFLKTLNRILSNAVIFGIIITAIIFAVIFNSNAQVSGAWDSNSTNGTPGYQNWGNGVIQLTSPASSGCAAATVNETSVKYNPCGGTAFNRCFQVLFGCPGSDNIGSDAGGDGMAFSFWTGSTFNINNGLACGGGLGYMGNTGDPWTAGTKMITIEFDTWSSQCNSNFDCSYGGGTSGNNDEIAVHINGNAQDVGRLTAVNTGNLEDGMEHRVCIGYNPATNILSVTIDGVSRLSYNLGGTNNLQTYFGCVDLNHSWSAGKFGATNYQVVSDGGYIHPQTGSLCPQMLPVEFLHVEAKLKNSAVEVNWSTATEKSNEKFIVQKSTDLKNWKDIGQIAGAGNSNSVINYSYMDYEPVTGITYYRLIQVDYDGKSAKSEVVSVNTTDDVISVVPNPFQNVVNIKSKIEGPFVITLHDLTGKILSRFEGQSEDGNLSFEPELPTGIYLITVQTDNHVHQQQVIKR